MLEKGKGVDLFNHGSATKKNKKRGFRESEGSMRRTSMAPTVFTTKF